MIFFKDPLPYLWCVLQEDFTICFFWRQLFYIRSWVSEIPNAIMGMPGKAAEESE